MNLLRDKISTCADDVISKCCFAMVDPCTFVFFLDNDIQLMLFYLVWVGGLDIWDPLMKGIVT